TIVGTVFMPYQYPLVPGSPTYMQGDMMLFAAYEDAQHIAAFQGVSLFLTRYKDFPTAQAESAAFEKVLTEQSPYVPVSTIVENPTQNAYLMQTRSFRDVLALLAIVSLVVSGFLVFNVVNALVVEQRRQIGVMKSLGAGGRDTFFMYAGISLLYGIIGVIPGVLLGIPLGYSATKSLESQLNFFIPDFQTSPPAILMGILLGLLVPLIASLLPVLNGIRVTILESITDLGIDVSYGQGWLARLVDIIPVPSSIRQALRNVIQKRGRLALTMITLSLAAGAFMGIYAVLESLNTFTDDIFGTFGNHISFVPHTTQEFAPMKALIENVDEVDQIEPGGAVAIEIEGFEPEPFAGGSPVLFALGLNPANPNIVRFSLRSGTAWQENPNREGVVITTSIADKIGKDTGDTIHIRTGGSTQPFEIIGVSNYPFPTVWFHWEQLARFSGLTRGAPTPNQYFTTVQLDGQDILASGVDDTAGMVLTFSDGQFLSAGEAIISQPMADTWGYSVGDTLTLTAGSQPQEFRVSGIFTLPPQTQSDSDVVALRWQDLAALEGRTLEGDPVPNSISIIMDKSDPTVEQVDQVIQEINDTLLAEGITANYTNWVENAEQVSQLIQTAGFLMNTAALLIAAVGAIGLFSTLSMSVFERQKEIGVMRSIGAVSSTIATQFLIEGWLVGLAAWLVGIPLSLWLFNAILDAFNFGYAVGITYPSITPVIGLAGMLLIATLSSLWPSIAAARKTVSDILRYQ
ncbi:MAG: ABC transporter permease, partial [Anaerolineae bacterium]|nr:ABC transporter permease [Anaerolineae bacterium]